MSQSNSLKPSAKNGSKVRRAKQGRLNVRNPTGPVAIYTEESESEVEQNENENDDNHDQDEEEDNVQENNQNGAAQILISQTDINVLRSATLNRGIVCQANFNEIMCFQAKKDAKTLKGAPLEEYLEKKAQKHVIANLVHAGSNLPVFNKHMSKSHVHLNKDQHYVAAAADCVAIINDILTLECQVIDVDIGLLTRYFNSRFADRRNRKAYEAKKKL